MVEIALVWCGIVALCMSVGWWIDRRWDAAFWWGFALVCTWLCAAHLFIPITPWLLLPLIPIAGAGWLRRRGAITGVGIVLLGVSALVLAGFATGASQNYDDGLYVNQLMQWYSQYAVVPGLANVHGRFGFNSIFVVWATVLDGLPGGASHYAMGGPALVVVGMAALGGWRWLRRQENLSDRVAALTLIPLAWWLYTLGTLETNAAALIVGLALIVFAIRTYETGDRRDLMAMLTIGALGVVIKLSLIVLVCALVLAVVWRQRRVIFGLGTSSPYSVRSLGQMLIVPALLIGVWVAHGFILTGQPLYPLSTVTADWVDWSVSLTQVINETQSVQYWARQPGVTYTEAQGLTWVNGWWERMRTNWQIALPGTLLMFSLLLSIDRRQRRRVDWTIIAAFGVAIAFWWWAAPDPDFGAAALWGLPIVLLAWARRVRLTLWIGLVALTLTLAVSVGSESLQAWEWRAERHGTMPTFTLDQGRLPGGTVIWYPVGDDRCGVAPLPCTPYPNDNLIERGKPLQDGFRRQRR